MLDNQHEFDKLVLKLTLIGLDWNWLNNCVYRGRNELSWFCYKLNLQIDNGVNLVMVKIGAMRIRKAPLSSKISKQVEVETTL